MTSSLWGQRMSWEEEVEAPVEPFEASRAWVSLCADPGVKVVAVDRLLQLVMYLTRRP